MPQKQKTLKTSWNECENCFCIIHSKDLPLHNQQECDLVKTNPTKSTHGFVKNGVLFGTTSHRVSDEVLSHVPVSLRDSVILLDSGTMQLCDIGIGKACILDRQYIKIAWPSNSVHPCHVEIPRELMTEFAQGQQVTVSAFPGSFSAASLMTITPRVWKDLYSEESFLTYMKNKLCGQYFIQGNAISISYYGQECVFEVKAIEASIECVYPVNIVQPDNIEELVSNLDISDTSLNASLTESPSKFKGQNRLELSNIPTFHQVTSDTKLSVICESVTKETEAPLVTFDSIGGQHEQIKSVKEMVQLPLSSAEIFQQYRLPLPKGVLVYGPSGSGKSLLLKALCNETKSHVISVSSADIMSKFYGESESRLRNIFKEAEQRAPSLIVMDDVDSLFPKRSSYSNETQKRLVAVLLTLMDGLSQASGKFVMVIAACCNPASLDSALRRPGRFDREIEMGIPSAKDRLQILTQKLRRCSHCLTDEDFKMLADKTHGYLGSDIDYICQQANFNALRRCMADGGGNPEITVEDIGVAMTTVQPGAMREVQLEIPKVKWTDIGGQETIKLQLKQAVEWPLKHPEAFVRMGIQPPRGVLMYGPPGCSKTMIAKALATESGLNFLAVKGPELFSKWVGESERAVREVFRKARMAAPSIVFFDEIDALAVERGGSGGSNIGDRVLAQLLTEIDGVERLTDVTVIAATNRPDMIDKALMRPGRLDRLIYVPLPDEVTRREILSIQLKKMPVSADVDIESLVSKTHNYSGAEVCAVCHEAAMFSLQENINNNVVSPHHFEQSLSLIKPRIGPDLLKYYENYQRQTSMS